MISSSSTTITSSSSSFKQTPRQHIHPIHYPPKKSKKLKEPKTRTKRFGFHAITSLNDPPPVHETSTHSNNPSSPPLYFKFLKSECKLVKCILEQHGFVRSLPESDGWSILWTGGHIKPKILKDMNPYQRVNHFPCTVEVTRKDKLYINLSRMAERHGPDVYGFVPKTYVLPAQWSTLMEDSRRERREKMFREESYINENEKGKGIARESPSQPNAVDFEDEENSHTNNRPESSNSIKKAKSFRTKQNGPNVFLTPYIVKPKALSRGRGIFLVNTPAELARLQNVDHSLVSKYVHNPLLIDGYKFDLRLYVVVTSFAPLRVYFYREGLGRFATEPYSLHPRHVSNRFMHLTNYSVNKLSEKFIQNTDPSIDNQGSKWSLTAIKRKLKSMGINVQALMESIRGLIIKTMIAVHSMVSLAYYEQVPHPRNCFELFGFDVLVDDTLKPWLLEVNLSPSLSCDSPLDLKIKGNMIADLLSMVGVGEREEKTSVIRSNNGKNRNSTAEEDDFNTNENIDPNNDNKQQRVSSVSTVNSVLDDTDTESYSDFSNSSDLSSDDDDDDNNDTDDHVIDFLHEHTIEQQSILPELNTTETTTTPKQSKVTPKVPPSYNTKKLLEQVLQTIEDENNHSGDFEMIYPSATSSKYDHLFDVLDPLTPFIYKKLFGEYPENVAVEFDEDAFPGNLSGNFRGNVSPLPRVNPFSRETPHSQFKSKAASNGSENNPSSNSLPVLRPVYSLYSANSKPLLSTSTLLNLSTPQISNVPSPSHTITTQTIPSIPSSLDTRSLLLALNQIQTTHTPSHSTLTSLTHSSIDSNPLSFVANSESRAPSPSPTTTTTTNFPTSPSQQQQQGVSTFGSWLLSIPIEEFEAVHSREIFSEYLSRLSAKLAMKISTLEPPPALYFPCELIDFVEKLLKKLHPEGNSIAIISSLSLSSSSSSSNSCNVQGLSTSLLSVSSQPYPNLLLKRLLHFISQYRTETLEMLSTQVPTSAQRSISHRIPWKKFQSSVSNLSDLDIELLFTKHTKTSPSTQTILTPHSSSLPLPLRTFSDSRLSHHRKSFD